MCMAVSIGAGLLFCALSPALQAQEQSAVGIVAGQPQPPQIKTFQGIEDDWSTSLVKADQYGMELLLSPYFVNISAAGDVDSRDQFIAFLFAKGATRPYSLEQRVVSVRVFGDVAVVSGTYESKVLEEGVPTQENGVFTNVFAETHGRWLCVNAQQTGLLNEPLRKMRRRRKH